MKKVPKFQADGFEEHGGYMQVKINKLEDQVLELQKHLQKTKIFEGERTKIFDGGKIFNSYFQAFLSLLMDALIPLLMS